MEQRVHAPHTLQVTGSWAWLHKALWSLDVWFSFPVFAAYVFACMVYLWLPPQIADPDIWWHLRNVQMEIATHAFLDHDVYSFTANGSRWINHEWLAEIPFYVGWRLLGKEGLFLVTLAAIEAIMLGVFYLAYTKSTSASSAMIASVLAAFTSTVSFGPRTLLFGWVCLVIELLLLERLLVEARQVWPLPVLFLFWVNLHGSWVIGVVVLFVFVCCTQVSMKMGSVQSKRWPWRRVKPLAISCCLSLVMLFVNPYGWRLVAYPFDLAFRQKLNIGTVEEWETLDFHSPRGKIFLLSIGLLFILQVFKGARWTLYELALVLIGIYAAVTYSRFLFLGGILIMPVLARYLPAQIHARSSYRGWMGVAVLLTIMPMAVKRFPTSQSLHEERKYPVQALSFLSKLPPQSRVFSEFLWGGFLEWNERQRPVFIDSRVDIFEYNGTLRDYLNVIQIRNSLEILDRYKIQYVLFEPGTPLTYLLEHNPAWKLAYQDDTAEVLERIDFGRDAAQLQHMNGKK